MGELSSCRSPGVSEAPSACYRPSNSRSGTFRLPFNHNCICRGCNGVKTRRRILSSRHVTPPGEYICVLFVSPEKCSLGQSRLDGGVSLLLLSSLSLSRRLHVRSKTNQLVGLRVSHCQSRDCTFLSQTQDTKFLFNEDLKKWTKEILDLIPVPKKITITHTHTQATHGTAEFTRRP